MEEIHAWLQTFDAHYTVTDLSAAKQLYQPRNPQSNKGDFGHVMLLAGSYGKMGAALMAARACLRAGAGLLTSWLPACGCALMQGDVPEAMVMTDPDDRLLTSVPPDITKFDVVACGPGIGTDAKTALMLHSLLGRPLPPLVLDADALNLISQNKTWLDLIPPGTVLTPHPKEFDRLFGDSPDPVSRLNKALRMAVKYRLIIVLKGHFTGVFCPDENVYFNKSGNAGMAKGGSGDVLTGITAALLGQYKDPEAAVRLAVFLHGLSGDIAADAWSQEAMLPTDLIATIGNAYLKISQKDPD